jgi:hypothetical protein
METNSQLHAPAALSPYPFHRRLCGPQSRSGRSGKEKNLIAPAETGRSARSLVSILTELPRRKFKEVKCKKKKKVEMVADSK